MYCHIALRLAVNGARYHSLARYATTPSYGAHVLAISGALARSDRNAASEDLIIVTLTTLFFS
jgi:hypothetical protein